MMARWGAALAAAVTAVLVVIPAAPAAAATPLVVFDGPTDGSTSATTGVPISGTAQIDRGPLNANKITGVTITVTLAGKTAAWCEGTGCGAGYGGYSSPFSFKPELTANGRYNIAVEVSADEYLNPSNLLGVTPQRGRGTTSVRVAVPPASPQGVTAHANPDRSVTVSWSRNTEPDIYGYQIQRLDPGSSNMATVVPFVPQSGASPPSWTDAQPAQTGGTFGYVVIVVRPDGDGGTSHPLSAASKIVGVSVPLAPAPPDSTSVPGAVNTGGTTSTVSTGAPRIDLSSFLAQASGAGATAPRAVVPTPGVSSRVAVAPPAPEPDPGFLPSLPFPVPPLGQTAQAPSASTTSGGGVPALGVTRNIGAAPASAGQRALLLPIATGLLLCVLGFHMRWFSRRTSTEWMEPLLPVLDFIAGGGGGAESGAEVDPPE